MASEMIDRSPRAESHTLRMEEERLRTYLSDRFGISTRFAPLSDVRAFLVSPPNDGRDKGLVVSSDATVAERIYLYLHVAAHLALGHHLPLATIETARSTDSFGRTNCAVPRPSKASRSTSVTFKSAPTPNEKIRLEPRRDDTRAAIASGSRSPTVGSPSVTNSTSPIRPAVTDGLNASSSAPEMFVDPDASSDSRYRDAALTFSAVA